MGLWRHFPMTGRTGASALSFTLLVLRSCDISPKFATQGPKCKLGRPIPRLCKVTPTACLNRLASAFIYTIQHAISSWHEMSARQSRQHAPTGGHAGRLSHTAPLLAPTENIIPILPLWHIQDGCVFLDVLTPPYDSFLSLSNFFWPGRQCSYYKVVDEVTPSSGEEKVLQLATDQPDLRMAAGRLFVDW